MAKNKKSLKVPNGMQDRYEKIVELSDKVCAGQLNESYAELARYATASLCRKRPSPLVSGKPASWACGIVYALGFVNFLFDKSTEPYISAEQLCKAFGVSKANGYNKSREVRQVLDLMQFDPDWTLPELMDENPLAWKVQVNGLIMDARSLPREIQELAYQKGFIPYLPGEKPQAAGVSASKPKPETRAGADSEPLIYQLKVTLKGSRPPIWRRIQVEAETSLFTLHGILQIVMEWEEAHLHQFVVGNPRQDPAIYSDPELNDGLDFFDTLDENDYTLKDIAPQEKSKFIYEYDFGDDWEHQIVVEKILPRESGVKYPRCVTGKRASPPEDVGGLWGYEEFQEIVQNPDHPERTEMLEWAGYDESEGFDPEYFDLEAINALLRQEFD